MENNFEFNKYFDNLTNTRLGYIIKSLDQQVTHSLRAGRIETRPCPSNGVWTCCLIPAILFVYNVLYKVSGVYSAVAYLSLGLLLYNVLFLILLSISPLVLTENIVGACLASSIFSTLLIYSLLPYELVATAVLCFTSVYLYSLLLRDSIRKFPRTFTLGESMIVCETILLYGVSSVLKFIDHASHGYTDTNDFVLGVVNIGLLTVSFIVASILVIPENRRDTLKISSVLGCAIIFALLGFLTTLGWTSIFGIVHFLFYTLRKNHILLPLWCVLLFVTVTIVTLRTKYGSHANTVARKAFHVLGSLVFITGIAFDINLLSLAAGAALGLLILVELLRKSDIHHISPALQSAFLVYADEKDCGVFAMTPIYLFCGLACPLIIVPQHPGYELELLSGVLAIGVGDTAASWYGSTYGVTKWTNSKKTIEGTIANIIAQILTVCVLQLFGLLNVNFALVRTAVSAAITGLVEAKTDQVDNLILPLVAILSFQITWILC